MNLIKISSLSSQDRQKVKKYFLGLWGEELSSDLIKDFGLKGDLKKAESFSKLFKKIAFDDLGNLNELMDSWGSESSPEPESKLKTPNREFVGAANLAEGETYIYYHPVQKRNVVGIFKGYKQNTNPSSSVIWIRFQDLNNPDDIYYFPASKNDKFQIFREEDYQVSHYDAEDIVMNII